ncbi:MAG: GspE/PulE family protein, partial [Sulfuricurvum sp.]
MDRITTDLLLAGLIMRSQVDRLLAKGIKPNLVLRDITLSGFMTTDRLIRFIVDKILSGEYDISVIEDYDYISEKDVLAKLAQRQNLPFMDLDSIDMDYTLVERTPLTQLKKYNAMPLSEEDLFILVTFSDPLDIEAQEA